MKHLKTFESYSVNEEFTKYDLNKWMASAAGVFSSALNVALFKWSKIPKIWKNVSDYRTMMDVAKHLHEMVEMQDRNPSRQEWINLLKGLRKDCYVKFSSVIKEPSENDLSMAYSICHYGDNLKSDISESINMINQLPEDKKITMKGVKEALESYSSLIDLYEKGNSKISVNEL